MYHLKILADAHKTQALEVMQCTPLGRGFLPFTAVAPANLGPCGLLILVVRLSQAVCRGSANIGVLVVVIALAVPARSWQCRYGYA